MSRRKAAAVYDTDSLSQISSPSMLSGDEEVSPTIDNGNGTGPSTPATSILGEAIAKSTRTPRAAAIRARSANTISGKGVEDMAESDEKDGDAASEDIDEDSYKGEPPSKRSRHGSAEQ